MNCCPNCFNDNFLQKHINANSIITGECSFCHSKDSLLIESKMLKDLFTPIVDMYLEDEDGLLLNELIQLDWNIFNIKDSSIQKKLIKNIFDNDISTNYNPTHPEKKQIIEQWESFRTELKHNNRFFPQNAPEIKAFGKYIRKRVEKGIEDFYRARINSSGEPIDSSKMGKPPKKESLNGRANPIGIPYLYVASSADTAIAEIRGHKGETVTVAKFEMLDDLILADLRDPKTSITPFGLEDDELELLYKNLPFIELLGEELTKPIVPREANLEYLPSQYLSEILKQFGFHGIIYKSSVSEGNNYVIFDDDKLKITTTNQYQITEVITSSKKLN
jgi:RES domain